MGGSNGNGNGLATLEHTEIVAKAKTRTVAICGTASSSRDEVLRQPADVELWGLNKSYTWMPRWDRWFDVHLKAAHSDPAQVEWMAKQTIPIYMREHYDHIPTSVRYPVEDVTGHGNYLTLFTSSIAYMIAMAVHEGVGEIRLLGVDMATGTEYAYQRDGCLYWVGIAQAKGIKVYIPDVSPLGRGALYGADNPLTDGRRAAMDWEGRVQVQLEKEQDEFLSELLKIATNYRRNLDACRGALQLAQKMVAESDAGTRMMPQPPAQPR